MGRMSRRFVAELDRFIARHGLPLVLFAKGQRKDDVMIEHLDNGVLSCADPHQLQQICDGLSAAKIDQLLRKWLQLLLIRLPPPI